MTTEGWTDRGGEGRINGRAGVCVWGEGAGGGGGVRRMGNRMSG